MQEVLQVGKLFFPDAISSIQVAYKRCKKFYRLVRYFFPDAISSVQVAYQRCKKFYRLVRYFFPDAISSIPTGCIQMMQEVLQVGKLLFPDAISSVQVAYKRCKKFYRLVGYYFQMQ